MSCLYCRRPTWSRKGRPEREQKSLPRGPGGKCSSSPLSTRARSSDSRTRCQGGSRSLRNRRLGCKLGPMALRPTIGLEVHAELRTRTKMFCDSPNDSDETRPNVTICPVCLAHPGTLPVINREAVRHVLRLGAAVGGALADFTEFDRKSYFYPDIPKGYQISQYEHPLVTGGELAGVAITRVHLEEDTARSTHADGKSLVDFNRAGIPLMELVTEPVIRDAETAGRFARELQLLLRTLGAG